MNRPDAASVVTASIRAFMARGLTLAQAVEFAYAAARETEKMALEVGADADWPAELVNEAYVRYVLVRACRPLMPPP